MSVLNGLAFPPWFSDAELAARGITADQFVHIENALSSPANVAHATNAIWLMPLVVRKAGILKTVKIRLATNGGAGARILLGVYNADPTSNLPSTLRASGVPHVADAGAPVVLSDTLNIPVQTGELLWLAYTAGAGTAPSVTSGNHAFIFNTVSSEGETAFFVSRAYDGTLPASLPLTGWTAALGPAVGITMA